VIGGRTQRIDRRISMPSGDTLIPRKHIPVTGGEEFRSPVIATATELVASEALLGEVEKPVGGSA
jgi:hypothetical protein